MNIMKSLLTLVVVLFFCTVAIAQNTNSNDKVDILKMDIVLVTSNDGDLNGEKASIGTEKSIARLYRHKNSRVKKALAFSTKKSRPKLA